MKHLKRILILSLCLVILCGLSGCVSVGDGRKVIRIAHAQSETHPEHIGLLKFKEYVEANLGDKYEVQIFPNELLGAAQKAIELTQTGAIEFVVAGTANLETFADVYEVFSMPYLFTSEEAYHRAMNNVDYMQTIYESTDEAGFRVLTWYNAGTRSFYAKKPIYTPADMKGMKMRVQQSPASVSMAQAFGAAASPMSFGEVYTAIQQGVIDGAENNELALTNNKHGEVAKYYSYTKHQMVPDMLIGNLKFLQQLPEEEYKIFEEAALLSTQVEMEEWDKQVEEAKQIAQEQMGVQFIDVDLQPFQDAVVNVQQEMLAENTSIQELYNYIQGVNQQVQQEQQNGTNVQTVPETPAASDAQTVPETPAASDAQIIPETPAASDAQIVPETPAASDVQIVPETPAASDAQVVPETSAASDAQVDSVQEGN